MAMVMRRPGISSTMISSATPEQKEQLRQDVLERTLKMTESQGEKDGLEGKPMDVRIIERTGEGPFSTKVAQRYSQGYVRGRETRGKGRGKKRGKKVPRKTRRVKKLNGRK